MLEMRYTEEQLQTILDQASIYVCACPAQICRQINNQRQLFDYQASCLDRTDIDRAVHERIAAAARIAHAELEQALTDVLRLEGWDMATLKMPKDLQKRIFDSLGDGA